MTTPINFIARCIEIERRVGDLYLEFSRRFTHDAEIEELFGRLAEEEYSHAGALELVSRVLRGFKGRAVVSEEAVRISGVIIADLDKALAMLKEGREISVSTAIGMAMKLESTMIENQAEGMIDSDSQELIKTFSMLRDQTSEHKERLRNYLRGGAGTHD